MSSVIEREGSDPLTSRSSSLQSIGRYGRQSFNKFSQSVRHLYTDSFATSRKPTPLISRPCRNEEEAACLSKLHEELQKRGLLLPPDMVFVGDLDSTLLRFARARKYDVQKTLIMIENTVKWRKEHDVAGVLNNPLDRDKVELIRKCRPGSYIGFDTQGVPVQIQCLGKIDVAGIASSGLTEEEILHYHTMEMEFFSRVLLRDASERAGRTVETVITIMDMAGLSLSSFTPAVKGVLLKQLQMDSDNYPEINGGTWIINTSFVFATIYRCVAPFLDAATRQKITVCANVARANAMLLEKFGKDMLPDWLGGTANFAQCQREFAARMDAACTDCSWQLKEIAAAASSNARVSLGGEDDQVRFRMRSTNSAPDRQFSTVTDGGDVYYTPSSTLDRCESLALTFDADSVTNPEGSSTNSPNLHMPLTGPHPNMSPQQGGSISGREVAADVADVMRGQDQKWEDAGEGERDAAGEKHVICRCLPWRRR